MHCKLNLGNQVLCQIIEIIFLYKSAGKWLQTSDCTAYDGMQYMTSYADGNTIERIFHIHPFISTWKTVTWLSGSKQSWNFYHQLHNVGSYY